MRQCPICKRPVSGDDAGRRYRPFCSRRCAVIDLGRWLAGSYGIPVVEENEETEPASPPEDPPIHH
jgi:hypothetical protein